MTQEPVQCLICGEPTENINEHVERLHASVPDRPPVPELGDELPIITEFDQSGEEPQGELEEIEYTGDFNQ